MVPPRIRYDESSVASDIVRYYEYIFHKNAVHAQICGNKMRSNVSGFVVLKIQNAIKVLVAITVCCMDANR